jgi:hypothetical protein
MEIMLPKDPVQVNLDPLDLEIIFFKAQIAGSKHKNSGISLLEMLSKLFFRNHMRQPNFKFEKLKSRNLFSEVEQFFNLLKN